MGPEGGGEEGRTCRRSRRAAGEGEEEDAHAGGQDEEVKGLGRRESHRFSRPASTFLLLGLSPSALLPHCKRKGEPGLMAFSGWCPRRRFVK